MRSRTTRFLGVIAALAFVCSAAVAQEAFSETRIDHDAIAGFMDAMTMSFEVADASLLEGVEPGMGVFFRAAVADRSAVIDRIGPRQRPR